MKETMLEADFGINRKPFFHDEAQFYSIWTYCIQYMNPMLCDISVTLPEVGVNWNGSQIQPVTKSFMRALLHIFLVMFEHFACHFSSWHVSVFLFKSFHAFLTVRNCTVMVREKKSLHAFWNTKTKAKEKAKDTAESSKEWAIGFYIFHLVVDFKRGTGKRCVVNRFLCGFRSSMFHFSAFSFMRGSWRPLHNWGSKRPLQQGISRKYLGMFSIVFLWLQIPLRKI